MRKVHKAARWSASLFDVRIARLVRALFKSAASLFAGMSVCCAPSHAGDFERGLTPPPLKPTITRWHGPYIGVIAGGRTVQVQRRSSTTTMHQRGISGLAGIVGGYSWKAPGPGKTAIFGIEADFASMAHLNNDATGSPNWQASVRARYGLFGTKLMAYTTAGFGLAGNADRLIDTPHLSPALVVGAGVEAQAYAKLRTRLEYLYTHTFAGGPAHSGGHSVRAAIIARLN